MNEIATPAIFRCHKGLIHSFSDEVWEEVEKELRLYPSYITDNEAKLDEA